MSQALSGFPAVLRASVSLGEGLWSSALFDEPLGFPFPPLCVFLGSVPWPHPPGHLLSKPLAQEGIYSIYIEAYFKVFIEV